MTLINVQNRVSDTMPVLSHRLIIIAFCSMAAQAWAADFDLEAFHQHAKSLHHVVIQTPECVGHDGTARGEFAMITMKQDFLPFEAITIAGPKGLYTSLTSAGDATLSDDVANDIGGVLNGQASELLKRIINDCKSEGA